MEIKKAIIPTAGLGTRFLPLSKILPKHLFPLLDKPLFYYVVKEAIDSGIKEIIFIISSEDRYISDYFKKAPELEKLLEKKGNKEFLKELKDMGEEFKNISFKYVVQKEPLGDAHALFLAKNLIKKEPVAALWVDDIVYSQTPCLSQLIRVFRTSNSPVVALAQVEKEKLSSYGAVVTEKISDRLYKIKKIVEKPKPELTSSNLVIVGKYILTPEVFEYISKAKPSFKGEIILAEVLEKMIEDGKIIYGYEFKGKWLECGDKDKWIKSFLYLAAQKEGYKKYLKGVI